MQIKRKLDQDPRYDAVGSSSLREELFNTFKKTTFETSTATTQGSTDRDSAHDNGKDENKDGKISKRSRAERAVLERESRVRAEQARTQAEMSRTRVALSREESERVFMCVSPFVSHISLQPLPFTD